MRSIFGEKIGMTQIFDEMGKVIPVSVVKAYPCVVCDIKTKNKHGYSSIQVGFKEVKSNKLNKPQQGYFKKKKLNYFKYLREIRLLDEKIPDYKIGDTLNVGIFNVGDFVDVSGMTKGRGFAGVVKRHNFSGGPASHGSMIYRRPMSIGSTDAARVIKGKRMPGHYGNERVTVQNLKVIKIDNENNIIVVKGAIPGDVGGLVEIKESIKKLKAESHRRK